MTEYAYSRNDDSISDWMSMSSMRSMDFCSVTIWCNTLQSARQFGARGYDGIHATDAH